MSSPKHSLLLGLGFSTCMAFFVVFDVTFVAPKVLERYDIIMKPEPLEQSRAEFNEDFGYWARSRQTLYASFVLPPIIGLALAITLRRYVRNLFLRNQVYLRKEMQGLSMRYEGLGLKDFRNEMREAISIFSQFLPLLSVIFFLYVLGPLVFPGRETLLPAFLAISGFASYGTWKGIFTQ